MNKNYVLVHPRKANRLMREFCNQVHDLTYEALILPPHSENDDILKIFKNAYCEDSPSECKVIKSDRYSAKIGAYRDDNSELIITYNFEEDKCMRHKQFRKDFTNRCKMAKGFSDVTLSLLHEIGHFETDDEFEYNEDYDRIKALKELNEKYPKEVINFEYFKLPDEKAATDWAIKWLSDEKNRKIAKAFEKELFKCFSKNS